MATAANHDVSFFQYANEESSDDSFGLCLRKLRKQQGKSIMEISALTGTSSDYLYKLERGEWKAPSDDRILALAEALDVGPDTLFVAAGRVPPDLQQALRQSPSGIIKIIRLARSLGPVGVDYVALKLESAVHDLREQALHKA